MNRKEKRFPGTGAAFKLLELAVTLLLLSIMVFFMARIAPGDPLLSYHGSAVERMSTSEKEESMERLGLNAPMTVQYQKWVKKAMQGDFGISYKYKLPVTEVIGKVALNSILLGGTGYVLVFFLALPLGAFCALREGKFADRVITRAGVVAGSIPVFLISLLMILLFSVMLGLFPASGSGPLGEASLGSRIPYLVLPVSTLLLSHIWYFGYVARNLYLEEAEKDYMLLHRIKGLSRRRILLRHGTRNIFPAYLTLMINSAPHLLGGSYIIEAVFGFKGLGSLAFESAKYHDYNLLMLIALLTGTAVIALNMAGEELCGLIHPGMSGRRRGYGSKRAV
ncbi:ABC transporter permease [Proteiniclasticum sp. SCR006]|uniref:ABC transporter permease n=1 Tax=Proteiniclasticum aestuarii TaxID=2817862 RepID=A0A939H773_9CLOT|nr:ABC transporter permease [Proteiniclasticum aestuarii]MBO1265464.1 ABC transporter permease [Proteiniclasticum aestuarii]